MIRFTVIGSSSKGNAYLVTDGVTSLLLDCGVRYKEIQRATGFNMRSLAGCLITHEHGDHTASIKEILKAGIDCYMSPGTGVALQAKLQYSHRINLVRTMETFKVGTWSILPFDTVHDAKEPLGFLLASGNEKLLFATDTAYIKYKFKGLTHIAIECNNNAEILEQNAVDKRIAYSHKLRVMESHFNLDNLVNFFKENDLSALKETWILHLSDGNSDERKIKQTIQMITGTPVYVAQAR